MTRSHLAQLDTVNPGRWPLHCHHLDHMATGMMT
ncbi:MULTISPECIES: multicopper oxidase domain-containing protein [Rhizobium]|nr:multicopper oxidase domain-containing protein [Rhizobium sp. NLR16a]